MTDLCQYVDVCISNEEDAKDVFGIEDVYKRQVFQLEPDSSSVIPMLSWQVFSTSGWMN